MNESLEKLPITELIAVSKDMGTVHYSRTKEKFMSTATVEDTAKKDPSARKKFTVELINAHRTKHGVTPVERLHNDHYDLLGKVVAEKFELEHPKGTAYVKQIDAGLRSPQKAAAQDGSGPNVEELLSIQGAPNGKSWREYIAELRTEAAMNKTDIIKDVYEHRKGEVESGALASSTITAMVSAAIKGLSTAKRSERDPNIIPLGDQVLGKYDELVAKYGASALDESGSLTGEARTEFTGWYEATRGGRVGKIERVGDRMAAHAMWDLNRRLKSKGIYVKPPRAVKEKVPASPTA